MVNDDLVECPLVLDREDLASAVGSKSPGLLWGSGEFNRFDRVHAQRPVINRMRLSVAVARAPSAMALEPNSPPVRKTLLR
jgi:hypothetical protein